MSFYIQMLNSGDEGYAKRKFEEFIIYFNIHKEYL
jgi:hypothetical protein